MWPCNVFMFEIFRGVKITTFDRYYFVGGIVHDNKIKYYVLYTNISKDE